MTAKLANQSLLDNLLWHINFHSVLTKPANDVYWLYAQRTLIAISWQECANGCDQ